MTASEHLSATQFPIEQIHNMYSGDFHSPMRSVRAEMRDEYKSYLRDPEGGYDPHPKDIEHGGPDNYVSHLAKDIKQHGVREPITIRNENVVAQGHHRYLAAVEAGLTHIPVRHTR